MKRKIVYITACVCLIAVVAMLMPTLAYTTSMDLTKINPFSWEGSKAATDPTTNPTEPVTTPLEKNEYALTVKKQFSSLQPTTSERFSFTLKSADSKAPMPGNQSGNTYSFSISGAGSVTLPAITFSSAGKYTYTITEDNTAAAGYGYDTSVYTVNFTVEKQGEELAVTNVDISMNSNGKEYKKLSEIAFTNTYTPTDDSGELPKMSDSAPIELYIIILIISSVGFVGCCMYLILSRNKSRYGKK